MAEVVQNERRRISASEPEETETHWTISPQKDCEMDFTVFIPTWPMYFLRVSIEMVSQNDPLLSHKQHRQENKETKTEFNLNF